MATSPNGTSRALLTCLRCSGEAASFNGDISELGRLERWLTCLRCSGEAASFNGDLSIVGRLKRDGLCMDHMFSSTNSFNQNLGNWYVVLDSTSIDIGSGATKSVGNIAAQNPFLD